MLFRRTRTLPPVPELPEFDRLAVAAGLLALADDVKAGDPEALCLIEDGILGPDTLSAYPANAYRQANQKATA